MTLDEAVKILNERKHHGHPGWYIPQPRSLRPDRDIVYGRDQHELFEPFEAIAVAEKYQREAQCD